MDSYVVYCHLFPNDKRYIGITCQKPNRRWQNGKGYKHNKYMARAIKKYGWSNVKHIILYNNLEKKEAESKEIEMIKKYKSNEREYGYNISNGGNTIGTHSKETKEKLRKIHLGKKGLSGENNPMYGKRGENNPNYGKHLSKITKEKIRKKLKGKKRTDHDIFCLNQSIRCKGENNPRARKINQYDINGNLIKTWNCAKYASEFYNLSNGNIINVCKGRQKTAKGFVWKYAE